MRRTRRYCNMLHVENWAASARRYVKVCDVHAHSPYFFWAKNSQKPSKSNRRSKHLKDFASRWQSPGANPVKSSILDSQARHLCMVRCLHHIAPTSINKKTHSLTLQDKVNQHKQVQLRSRLGSNLALVGEKLHLWPNRLSFVGATWILKDNHSLPYYHY